MIFRFVSLASLVAGIATVTREPLHIVLIALLYGLGYVDGRIDELDFQARLRRVLDAQKNPGP